MVTEAVAAKSSDWTITAGRGFPLRRGRYRLVSRLAAPIGGSFDEGHDFRLVAVRRDETRLTLGLGLASGERTSGTQI